MATIAFVAAGTAVHSDGSTDITPGLPAGWAEGDLLLIWATAHTATVPVAPAGYSQISTSLGGPRALFGKYATASESAPTVGRSVSSTDGFSAQMAAFRNAQISPLSNGAIVPVPPAQNIQTPGAAVPRADSVVIVLGTKADDWTSVTPPSGFTEIGEPDTTLGTGNGITWAYKLPSDTTSIAASSFVVTGGTTAACASAVVVLPALSVTAQAQDVYPPRALVTVAGITLGDSVELYRVVGGVRTLVRGGATDSAIDSSFVRVDAELPFGVPVAYTAVVAGVSYTSTPTTYTLTGGKVALSDAVSGLSAEVVILAWSERAYSPQASVFKVGGRNVVVSADLGQFESTIEFFTATTSSRDNLWRLMRNATEGIIQMRQPGGYDGVDCYLSVLDAREQRWSQDGTDQRRRHVIQVAEVEAWASVLEAHGYTLQDLADAYAGQTLADLDADYPTLLALAQGDFGV